MCFILFIVHYKSERLEIIVSQFMKLTGTGMLAPLPFVRFVSVTRVCVFFVMSDRKKKRQQERKKKRERKTKRMSKSYVYLRYLPRYRPRQDKMKD